MPPGNLIPLVEAAAADHDKCELVFFVLSQSVWIQDLPLCFPSRTCVDVPPGGAYALYVISNLTAASPGIAAALWAGLGVSLVLIGNALRQQWRGFGVRTPVVVLAIALVVAGTFIAWSTNGWLGEAGLIYGGLDGQPAESVPKSIIGSWPLVRSGALAGLTLGAIALFLMLNTVVVRRNRAARAHGATPE